MKNICIEIGRKIREFRKSREISQDQLAARMGTTPNTISRWETGANKPSIEDLDRLADVFGVPIVDFFPQPKPSQVTAALLNAAQGLAERDIEELVRFALFRRATSFGTVDRSRPDL